MADVNMVMVRVLPGRSLTLPDGRIVGAGEELALPDAEADFAVRMGAAEPVQMTGVSSSPVLDGTIDAPPSKPRRKTA